MIVKMILLVFCLVLASCDETTKGKANGYPSGLMVTLKAKTLNFTSNREPTSYCIW
jgi:hypothetical protein